MRKTLPWIVCICLVVASGLARFANGASSGDLAQYLRPGHPDVYTVVKGDTLWDISARFLSLPWLWPEVWRINPQIENPHLIYPGDDIRLVFVDGEPTLNLERGTAGRTYKGSPGEDGRLKPTIRVSALDTAIPAIPLDAVQGYLVENRVVRPAELFAAPYVLEGEGGRLIIGSGDRLYVRGVLPDSVAYNFVRKGPTYVDPVTGEVLGQEATYLGLGRVVAKDLAVSTMLVNSTRQEIQMGDRVLPTEERNVQSTFYPSSPGEDVEGLIISVFGGVTQVGQYDVVVLNRGGREGLQIGNVLAIYKRGELTRDRIANEVIRLPSERAGLLMVFRVFEKLSYGLVLNAERPLAVEDEVRNP